MTKRTSTRQVTVLNPQGLHARPADMLVKLANRFSSKVELIKDGEYVDGKSILSVLTLAAVQGTRLSVRATGDDADDALNALVDLFERGFAEETSAAGREVEQPDS